jgi:hypothetical protein
MGADGDRRRGANGNTDFDEPPGFCVGVPTTNFPMLCEIWTTENINTGVKIIMTVLYVFIWLFSVGI